MSNLLLIATLSWVALALPVSLAIVALVSRRDSDHDPLQWQSPLTDPTALDPHLVG